MKMQGKRVETSRVKSVVVGFAMMGIVIRDSKIKPTLKLAPFWFYQKP
jgi:hypothetical protein